MTVWGLQQQERERERAPRDLEPRDLLHQIDSTISKREPCRLYAPDLCEAAGLTDRAAMERRRFEMITGSLSQR